MKQRKTLEIMWVNVNIREKEIKSYFSQKQPYTYQIYPSVIQLNKTSHKDSSYTPSSS